MIREVIREAWDQSPLAVLLTVPAAVLAVIVGWALLVVFLVAFGAA